MVYLKNCIFAEWTEVEAKEETWKLRKLTEADGAARAAFILPYFMLYSPTRSIPAANLRNT
jgi:hypothetical protein